MGKLTWDTRDLSGGGSLRNKEGKRGFFLILAGILILGIALSLSSSAEIYKYMDPDGVNHLFNVPEDKYDFVLKDGWVRFHLGNHFEKYDLLISKASQKHSVDYALIQAVIKVESNFNPLAVSRAGAKGLMQLMPGTASALGVNDSLKSEDNIQGGVRHLHYLLDLFNGNLHLALAAYNTGEDAVFRYNGIPPYQETRTYIRRVLQYFRSYNTERKNSILFRNELAEGFYIEPILEKHQNITMPW